MKSGGKVFFVLALICTFTSCGILGPLSKPEYQPDELDSLVASVYSPLGTLQEIQYNTSVPGPTSRRLTVYLPEEYFTTNRRYPVVYLLHGARGYESSWIMNGDILKITDSLTVNNLAEPAIIVMPNMNQYNDDFDMGKSRKKNTMEALLDIDGVVESSFVRDVVSLTDSLYRTIPDKSHRAICGNSIGGLQSIYISANNPDAFDYIGLFSPVTKVISKPGEYNGLYKYTKDKLKVQFDKHPSLYYITIGDNDILLQDDLRYHRFLKRHHFEHTFIITSGGHDWDNWQSTYRIFLMQVFK